MANLDATSRPLTLQNAGRLVESITGQAIARATGAQADRLNIGSYGFLFDIIGDESIEQQMRITDHYTEDNKAIQDHIAQGPEMFTVRGYVGEVTSVLSQGLEAIITAVDRLNLIDTFIPQFTEQATQFYGAIANTLGTVNRIVGQVQNAYDLFTQKDTSATKQQAAFTFFKSMALANQSFTVETPYGIFDNMYIDRIRAKQDEVTKYVSDFSITFKRIRTVQDFIVLNLPGNQVETGRLGQENSENVDQGLQQVNNNPATEVDVENLTKYFHIGITPGLL